MIINADLYSSIVGDKVKQTKRKEQVEKNLGNLIFLPMQLEVIKYIIQVFCVLSHQTLLTQTAYFLPIESYITKLFCCRVNLMAQISLRVMNVRDTRGPCQRIMTYDNLAKCRARVTFKFRASCKVADLSFFSSTERKLHTQLIRAIVISSELSLLLRIYAE